MLINIIALLGCVYSLDLKILQPAKLYFGTNNTVRVDLADFGYVPYGFTISGHVMKSIPINACEPFTLHSTTFVPKIAIVDRGNCTFTVKAHNAENAGAKMLIIVDNVVEDIERLHLIQDHSNQVNIPTVMVSNADGLVLYEAIAENPKLIVSIEFLLPKQEVVDLKYFMISFDPASYPFLQQFQYFAKEIGPQMNFTPLYGQGYCPECAKRNFTGTNDFCISGGRYCSQDVDKEGPLIGRDVVFEELRQLCVLESGGVQRWWNYMINFKRYCLDNLNTENQTTLEQCSENCMYQSAINLNQVKTCMNNSFTGPNPLLDDNIILSKQRELIINSLSDSWWPSLQINGIQFRGDLALNTPFRNNFSYSVLNYPVLEGVCDGFIDKFRPIVCLNATQIYIDGKGGGVHYKQSNSDWIVWVIVICCLLAGMFLAFLIYRRAIRKQVHEDLEATVNQQLSNYYHLQEQSQNDKQQKLITQ